MKGFSLCQRGPELTHLLFVDDSLLFYKATMEECKKIIKILESYEMGLGQTWTKIKLPSSLASPPQSAQNRR